MTKRTENPLRPGRLAGFYGDRRAMGREKAYTQYWRILLEVRV